MTIQYLSYSRGFINNSTTLLLVEMKTKKVKNLHELPVRVLKIQVLKVFYVTLYENYC